MYGKIFLTLSSIIVILFVLEIIVRNIIPTASPYYLKDGRLIWDNRGFWINQPNQSQHYTNIVDFNNKSMRTDNSGLRYVPCRKNQNPNSPKIYIFGDSQTFGFGVSDQETWANQLQCLISKKKLQYNVFNLGVPGTNIDQYIARTKMIFNNLKKRDVVIYAITWNDFHTTYSKTLNFKPSPSCSTDITNHPIFCPPNRNKFHYRTNTWRRKLYESTGIFVPSFSNFKDFVNTVIYTSAIASIIVPIMRGLYIKYRKSNTLEKIGSQVFYTSNNLIRLLDRTIRQKTENVIFVFLPSRISYVRELFDLYSNEGENFPEQDFLWYFAQKSCEDYSINCISLFQALKTHQTGTHDYPFDGHLNKTGSKKVAQALFNYVLSNIPVEKDRTLQ